MKNFLPAEFKILAAAVSKSPNEPPFLMRAKNIATYPALNIHPFAGFMQFAAKFQTAGDTRFKQGVRNVRFPISINLSTHTRDMLVGVEFVVNPAQFLTDIGINLTFQS